MLYKFKNQSDSKEIKKGMACVLGPPWLHLNSRLRLLPAGKIVLCASIQRVCPHLVVTV